MLSASTASSLLAAARAGSTEILGALDGSPVLVVELGPDDDVGDSIAPGLPCVVAAFSRHLPRRPAPAGVDVAVCGAAAAAPPGWVAVSDVDAEIGRLCAQIIRFPQPAVVLAQLLRVTATFDVGAGLVAESMAYSTLQAGPAFASWLAGRRPRGERARHEPDHAVVVERAGDRLTVTLNRPHVRNAVDSRLRGELAEALAVAVADPSIRRVELVGAGPDFSSGGDLDEFGALDDPSTAHLVRTARSPARLMAAVSDRVTAHLHGACVGAGIELAAFAGRVAATPDVRCLLPEIPLGLLPGSGGTVSIPRRIGRHRTAWLALGATAIATDTALAWGLVDDIVSS